MAYSTVTLTGTYQKFDATPAEGVIEIIPSEKQVKDTAGNVILSGRVKVTLDAAGSFSVDLPATDDQGLNPTNFGYTLVAKLRHTHLPAVSFSLPAATPTVDIEDVTTVDPSTFDPTATYVEPTDLATVATTGAYVDLTGQPTIPSTAADVGALPDTTTAADLGAQSAATLDTDMAALVPASSGSETAGALSATYGWCDFVRPGVKGVVGDGVTDDTAAIQAILDAAPEGGTVYFLRPTGGQANYLVSSLTITTPRLRLMGGGKDTYSVALASTAAGGTILTVKESGLLVTGLGFVGDGADRGAGATVTGIDFYGTPAGDIDAEVARCTFANLATGIRARSRNVYAHHNLFSNSLNAATIQGRDTSYHTTAADAVRGIVVNDNRFHSIGNTATDAAVLFTGLADFQHGEVSDNYFDTYGNARGIVAVGSSGAPIKSLTAVGNKHADVRAAAYDYTYCEDFVIEPTAIVGDSSGAFDYDGITLTNCNIGRLVNPFLSRVGRSGIKGTGNTNLEIVKPRVQSGGLYSGSTGHGIDLDSTNSAVEIDGPWVQGVDGYGVNGSPGGDSILSGGRFSSCTLGSVNSTTLRNITGRTESVFVPGAGMATITGSPAPSSINSYGVLMFDASATEQASTIVRLPEGWLTYDVELWWLSTADTAGNVLWGTGVTDVGDGSQLTSGAYLNSPLQAVTTGITNRVKKFTARTGLAVPASGVVGFRVARIGGDTGDTYGSDAGLVGLRFVRAS